MEEARGGGEVSQSARFRSHPPTRPQAPVREPVNVRVPWGSWGYPPLRLGNARGTRLIACAPEGRVELVAAAGLGGTPFEMYGGGADAWSLPQQATS